MVVVVQDDDNDDDDDDDDGEEEEMFLAYVQRCPYASGRSSTPTSV